MIHPIRLSFRIRTELQKVYRQVGKGHRGMGLQWVMYTYLHGLHASQHLLRGILDPPRGPQMHLRPPTHPRERRLQLYSGQSL